MKNLIGLRHGEMCNTAKPRHLSGTDDEAVDRALAMAHDYIASRQCRNGGFCFYRTAEIEEANLHDTYYAVAACRLFGRMAFDRERLTNDYLHHFVPAALSFHALYYYLSTVRLLDMTPDTAVIDRISRLRIAPRAAEAQVPLAAWLDMTLKTVELKKAFVPMAVTPAVADTVIAARNANGINDKPNLEDTRLALLLLTELGCPGRAEYFRSFVSEMQTPGTGFRLTRDSALSNIDVIHAGVVSCALLDLPVRYCADVLRAVLLSQRTNGGFSRTPGSQGDMRTHYRALAILRRLSPTTARTTTRETNA